MGRLDGGATFTGTLLTGSNYGFYFRDRETLLALQGGGIYRLVTTLTHEPGGVIAVAPPPASESGFALEQNRPNPFDGATEIRFTLPGAPASPGWRRDSTSTASTPARSPPRARCWF